MNVPPVPLQGRDLRLEPLQPHHAERLFRVASPKVYRYATIWPDDDSFESFAAYLDARLALPWQNYVMVERATATPVGLTAYLDIRPQHRGLEVGATWITPAYQGTSVNPECKYLLLQHAFEHLGAVRVQLKTDGRNLQSQRAIARLGAQREGVLRRHTILPDGFIRDTVMFSITDAEWPAVRRGLEKRLGWSLPERW